MVINASAAATLLEQRPEKIQALSWTSAMPVQCINDRHHSIATMDKINFGLYYTIVKSEINFVSSLAVIPQPPRPRGHPFNDF